jgi:hypothetical protein
MSWYKHYSQSYKIQQFEKPLFNNFVIEIKGGYLGMPSGKFYKNKFSTNKSSNQ